MKEKLFQLLKNSYSPYSNFKVAAIVVTRDNHEFNGVNIENASYGATVCAERVAIASAVAAGYKKGDLKELYIMVDSPKISTCCFVCRQVIIEFFSEDCNIICMNNKGEIKKYTVSELCPSPFSEDDLK